MRVHGWELIINALGHVLVCAKLTLFAIIKHIQNNKLMLIRLKPLIVIMCALLNKACVKNKLLKQEQFDIS